VLTIRHEFRRNSETAIVTYRIAYIIYIKQLRILLKIYLFTDPFTVIPPEDATGVKKKKNVVIKF
jgi:hypothetical protein